MLNGGATGGQGFNGISAATEQCAEPSLEGDGVAREGVSHEFAQLFAVDAGDAHTR